VCGWSPFEAGEATSAAMDNTTSGSKAIDVEGIFTVIGDVATETSAKLSRSLSDFGKKAKPHLISFGENSKSKSVEAIDELKSLYQRISNGAVVASSSMLHSIKSLIKNADDRTKSDFHDPTSAFRAVHEIDCSECGDYIVGIRYVSVLVSPIGTYNLCAVCESSAEVGHPLLKLKIPENGEVFQVSSLQLNVVSDDVTLKKCIKPDLKESDDDTSCKEHSNVSDGLEMLRSMGFTDFTEEDLLLVLKEVDSIDDAISRLLETK
jgi:hypothetical protein